MGGSFSGLSCWLNEVQLNLCGYSCAWSSQHSYTHSNTSRFWHRKEEHVESDRLVS